VLCVWRGEGGEALTGLDLDIDMRSSLVGDLFLLLFSCLLALAPLLRKHWPLMQCQALCQGVDSSASSHVQVLSAFDSLTEPISAHHTQPVVAPLHYLPTHCNPPQPHHDTTTITMTTTSSFVVLLALALLSASSHAFVPAPLSRYVLRV